MKSIFIIFLLFLPVSVMAQVSVAGRVDRSIIIDKYIQNITVNNITVAQIDTVAIENITRKEVQPIIEALTEQINDDRLEIANLKQNTTENAARITELEDRIQALGNALLAVKKREVILQEKKWNYLPFGVYQFTHKQTGKGIFFAVTEVGLLGTSIGYYISAQQNLDKHKDNRYDPWERDRFHSKYESQLRASGWFLAGTALMIGLNYCDNFNWFRKNNVTVASVPTLDWQGNPQMIMTLSMTF